MKKAFTITYILVLIVYVLPCTLLYLNQEAIIFFPQKLAPNHLFSFEQPFEEIVISTQDHTKLHGILFKAKKSKGLIFFLHGNAGSLATWGELASIYTQLNYDIFMLDYRGFGKSEGNISNEEELLSDVQASYNQLKEPYPEPSIIVLGYSIGTGPAAWLAAHNHPQKLILQAPYFSMVDMMQKRFSIVPTFLLKYKLETNRYLANCSMPIVLFHGDKDEVIPYESSLRLQQFLKKGDTLILLKGQKHNKINLNSQYQQSISSILP